jgi:hypothetical protein
MKRLIVTIIAISVLMCLFVGMLTGCASTQTDSSEENYNKAEQASPKLVVVYKDVSIASGVSCLLDTETGVEYWFVKNGYGAGLAPRLNPDGSYRTYNDETTAEDSSGKTEYMDRRGA